MCMCVRVWQRKKRADSDVSESEPDLASLPSPMASSKRVVEELEDASDGGVDSDDDSFEQPHRGNRVRAALHATRASTSLAPFTA